MLESDDGVEDWMVENGAIAANEASSKAELAAQEARRAQDRAREAWLGATLGALLQKHAWLAGCTIELESEPEYDDQGGTFYAVQGWIAGVAPVQGVELPDSDSSDGEFDSAAAEEVVRSELEDDFADIHAALRLGKGVEGSVELRRKVVANALVPQRVSGRAVFEALLAANALHGS